MVLVVPRGSGNRVAGIRHVDDSGDCSALHVPAGT